MPRIIHIFRHGQTDWNNLRRMQGHTDIPLNEEGRKQAQSLQTFFSENPIDVIFSSDLVRAQETAHIANAHLECPVHLLTELREVSLGVLEGMVQDDVHSQFGIEAWQKWTSIDPENLDFHFPSAESAREAIARFDSALRKICKEHVFKNAAISTHGFVMRRFLHMLRPDLTEILPTPNCVVYTVLWDEKSEKFSFYFNS